MKDEMEGQSEGKPPITSEDYEIATDGLKVAINEILWVRLPPTVTLGQAEAIAERWWEDVDRAWKECGATLDHF